MGGSGNDTYVFDVGFNADTITDNSGTNIIDLSTMNSSGFSFTSHISTFTIMNGTNSIYFTNGATNLEVMFADTTLTDFSDYIGSIIGSGSVEGTSGNDYIVGSNGADSLY